MRLLLLGSALLALAACGDSYDPPEATSPATDPINALPAAPHAATWSVSPRGAGPVRIGMTLDELASFITGAPDSLARAGRCTYVPIEGAPDSLLFMVEQGRLVRIDVLGGPTATDEGLRVGDPVARIRAAYPAIRETPNKYVETDRDFVALPGAPADSLRRYVFETDGARIRRYRAGVMPQVAYVEGCS